MLAPRTADVINELRALVVMILPLRDKYVSLYDEAYATAGVTASLDANPSGSRQTYSDPTPAAALNGFKNHQRNCLTTAANEIHDALRHLLDARDALEEGFREQVTEFKNICYHCGQHEPKGLLKGLCHKDYQYVRSNPRHELPSWDVLNKRDLL